MRRQAFKCRLLGAGWWRLWGWWGAEGREDWGRRRHWNRNRNRQPDTSNACKTHRNNEIYVLPAVMDCNRIHGMANEKGPGWVPYYYNAKEIWPSQNPSSPGGRKWISGNDSHELLVCRCLLGQPSRKVFCVNFQCIKFIRRALPVWTLRKIRSEIQKFSRFISTKEYQCNYKKRK